MQYADLKIIEENGWLKQVTLSKAITLVGSAVNCDVQLNGRSIPPVQCQILSSSDLPTGCRLVNLSDPIPFLNNGETRTIAQYGSCDINQADELKLGEFRIVFELPFKTEQQDKTDSMEASLSFSNAALRPEFPLEGKLVVKNLGKQQGTQFQVDLQGLPADCYQVDPIPLLYPGAQEEIRLRLFHHTFYPEAGLQTIFIVVTAQNNYPGEELVLEQHIYVSAVFNQKLEVLDDVPQQVQQKAKVIQKDETWPVAGEPAQAAGNGPDVSSAPIPEIQSRMEEPLAPVWPPSQVPENDAPQAVPGAWLNTAPTELQVSDKTTGQTQEVLTPTPVLPVNSPAVADPVLLPNKAEDPLPIILPQPETVVALPDAGNNHEVVQTPVVSQPRPAAPAPDRSKLKVIRQPSKDFWNED